VSPLGNERHNFRLELLISNIASCRISILSDISWIRLNELWLQRHAIYNLWFRPHSYAKRLTLKRILLMRLYRDWSAGSAKFAYGEAIH